MLGGDVKKVTGTEEKEEADKGEGLGTFPFMSGERKKKVKLKEIKR